MPRTEFLNPEGLHHNPAFSQVATVDGAHRLVYVGGQNAVDSEGNIVGQGDLGAQCEQVARNLQTALSAAGARVEHVVKWTVYVVQGHPARAGFEAFGRVWGRWPNPPTISVIYVAGLAHPDFLVEVDAVAAVPVGQ